MNRKLNPKYFLNDSILELAGIDISTIELACNYTHSILDTLDDKLISAGAVRIAHLVELANLSSIVGNLLGAGIVQFSDGQFERNGPHKYPDILSKTESVKDIEIKVALELNKPKGHLAKEGFYLICRYVLTQENGVFDINNRGDIVWIWEIRFGFLNIEHFNISNTSGDSGKTAAVNSLGMNALKIIYCDLDKCPNTKTSKTFKYYQSLFQ